MNLPIWLTSREKKALSILTDLYLKDFDKKVDPNDKIMKQVKESLISAKEKLQ